MFDDYRLSALENTIREARAYATREGFHLSTICPSPEDTDLLFQALAALRQDAEAAMREAAAKVCERKLPGLKELQERTAAVGLSETANSAHACRNELAAAAFEIRALPLQSEGRDRTCD